MSGGTLDADESLAVSGALSLTADITIDVASGKTLTYSGAAIGVGDYTITLTGGGTLDNTNNLKLDDPGSLLAISDSTKISRLLVNASGTNGGMTISSSVSSSTGNLVGNLSLSDSFSVSSDSVWSVDNITADTTLTFSTDKNVNFGALTLTGSADFSLGTGDITLSVSSPVTVGNTQKLQNGGGSFNFLGGLSLETGSELIGQGKQVSGNIVLNGGQIATEQNTVLTDNLTQSADSTIEIDTSKTLTYSGAVVDIGTSTLNVQGGGSFINSAVSALSLNNAGSHLVLDNVTVGFVTASAASNSTKGLKVSVDSTLTNLSLTDKLRLSVDSGKTLTLAGPLTVPTQGLDLAGAGTLDLSDNLTLNGNVTLASGSLTIDARGLQLNLGGDLNLVGGVLLTDNSTNFHLLANSTLTTNAEQTVANVTIPANEAPMLTLGSNTTKLEVVNIVSIANSCPQSLPIQPKAQVKLVGGSQINAGGTLCIDGWLEGDIVLNGGTLHIDADTTISSDSSILLSSSSNLRIVGGSSLTYEGDALNVDNKTLSLSGGGSLVLNSDGSNPVTLNNADGELEFSGDNITTVSHVKTSSGATTNMPTLKMTGSGVIQNLAHEEFSEINFASGKTLSITEAFEVPYGKQMTILGAAGTLTYR